MCAEMSSFVDSISSSLPVLMPIWSAWIAHRSCPTSSAASCRPFENTAGVRPVYPFSRLHSERASSKMMGASISLAARMIPLTTCRISGLTARTMVLWPFRLLNIIDPEIGLECLCIICHHLFAYLISDYALNMVATIHKTCFGFKLAARFCITNVVWFNIYIVNTYIDKNINLYHILGK